MFRTLLALALLAAPASALAQEAERDLTLEQQMLLRCSAAFALVAGAQEAGEASALTYPDIRATGREFFVRSSAQLMDETGLSREELAVLLSQAAQDIRSGGTLDQLMPVCLPLLPGQAM